MHKFGMTVCLVLSVMCQAVGTAASDRLPLDLKNQHVVHRGWGLAWPHNTMVSIRKCWQERLLPEVDARLCKERKIFAMHDLNGNFDLKKVPWSELAEIDVGVAYGKRWKGEHPPLWEDIMSEMRGHPERRVMVDLKDATPEMIAEMAKRHGVERQLVGFASNVQVLQKWKRLIPGIETRCAVHPKIWRRSFLQGQDAEKMRKATMENFAKIEAAKFEGVDLVKFIVRVDPLRKDPFCIGREYLKESFAKVHAAGKRVGVWVWYGGEKIESYRLLRAIGVDNFGTDYPETLLEFLREERGLSESKSKRPFELVQSGRLTDANPATCGRGRRIVRRRT